MSIMTILINSQFNDIVNGYFYFLKNIDNKDNVNEIIHSTVLNRDASLIEDFLRSYVENRRLSNECQLISKIDYYYRMINVIDIHSTNKMSYMSFIINIKMNILLVSCGK